MAAFLFCVSYIGRWGDFYLNDEQDIPHFYCLPSQGYQSLKQSCKLGILGSPVHTLEAG